jgi:hypothetical protein
MPRLAPPWYERGLRFGCTGCHRCCRGAQAGQVYVSTVEVERIAAHLGSTVGAFRRRHVRRRDGYEVIRLEENGDCSLWADGCTVYPARPRQCRTFPFWPENLRTPAAWREVGRDCVGIGRGTRHSLRSIEAILRGRETPPGRG